MITIMDVLKTDPYRDTKGAQFYIDKEDFYDEEEGVYVKPAREICELCRRSVEDGNRNIKMLRINGYAGCGKTLLAHYVIHKYGYDDDYYYEFDHEAGRNYSLSYILKTMINKLSHRLSIASRKSPTVMKIFHEAGKKIYGESDEYKMLYKMIYDDNSWINKAISNQLDVIDDIQYEVTIIESMEDIVDTSKYKIADSVKFLLLCDCLWRCSEVFNDNRCTESKYVFCLLDNIDNLSRKAVVDLYVAICDVINKLEEIFKEFNHYRDNLFSNLKCIFLFPTREVTERRLREGLRKQNRDDLLQGNGEYLSVELQDKNSPPDEIIASRKQYCIKKQISDVLIKEVNIIESFMRIPFVNTQFSKLLNGNYSQCVDRIMDIWVKMPDWVKACEKLQEDKMYGSDFTRCSQEGARGFLLRMLLELFKSRDVYESVTDTDDEYDFNVNGKLGLHELECEAEPGKYCVSISRLLLTFIRGSKDQKVKINHIFECFSYLDGKEICRYLYALSENIRDTWRRLIVFSSNVPNSVNDLYKQYELYQSNPNIGAGVFSEVELCLSGKTYVQTVVPNFEFFLSRLNMKSGINVNPPLFSEKSISYRGESVCLNSIEKVLSSIETCADEIFRYDEYMVNKCILSKNNQIENIGKLFVESKSKMELAKQSHLSRIIFSHISYIERFRRYLMYILNEGEVEYMSDDSKLLNEQIVSYIIRYLMLFDPSPFYNEYACLLNNSYISEQCKEQIKHKKTCKDIFCLIDSKCELKRFPAMKKEIALGYLNQKRAQIKLLEEIMKIHSVQYSILSKIEIE